MYPLIKINQMWKQLTTNIQGCSPEQKLIQTIQVIFFIMEVSGGENSVQEIFSNDLLRQLQWYYSGRQKPKKYKNHYYYGVIKYCNTVLHESTLFIYFYQFLYSII